MKKIVQSELKVTLVFFLAFVVALLVYAGDQLISGNIKVTGIVCANGLYEMNTGRGMYIDDLYTNNGILQARALYSMDGSSGVFLGDASNYVRIQAGLVDGVDVSAHAADTTTAHGMTANATANKLALRDATGSLVATGLYADVIQLGTSPTVAGHSAGRSYYDTTWKTVNFEIGSATKLQVGQEEVCYVYNNSGGTINEGEAVYCTGTGDDGGGGVTTITIGKAKADSSTTADVIGVATETISSGAYGNITVRGMINNIDTSGFSGSAGDSIYLSETTAGALTTTTPESPNLKVEVGRLIVKDATTGRINIRINRAYRLGDLEDVTAASPNADDVLKWNGVAWVNGAATTSSASAGIEFFLNDTKIIDTGTENDYAVETLNKYPVTTSESVDTISCATNTVLKGAYLYNTALGRTSISAGIWNFGFYGSVNSILAGRVSTITANVYYVVEYASPTVTITGTGTSRTCTASSGTPFATSKIDASATNTVASYVSTPNGFYQITARTSDTEVTITVPTTYTNESGVAFKVWKKLFGVTTPAITNITPNYGLVSVYSAQPAFTVSTADKLGITMFGTSNNTTTITYVYGNSARYTHFDTPLITLHGDLAGLQGGTGSVPTEQYYHLTLAQHTDVVNATNSNTPSTVVKRDGSGDFSAGTITAALTGNASTATALATARLFTVTDNDGTNSQAAASSFDGSANYTIKLPATIKASITGNCSGSAGSVAVGGITGLGSGVATWLATPSSSNLATAITDETGSGALVFATSPTLTALTLGSTADDKVITFNATNKSGTLTYTYATDTFNFSDAVIAPNYSYSSTTGNIIMDELTADTEQLIMRSTGSVSHSFTNITGASTYGRGMKIAGSSGGFAIAGFSSGTIGMQLRGYIASGSADTTSATNSTASIVLDGYKSSGANGVALASSENVLSLSNGKSAMLLVKGDGSIVPSSAGTSSLGSSANYWNDINGATLNLTDTGTVKMNSVNVLTCSSTLYNTFVGRDAGYSVTTADKQTAVGYQALYSGTTGSSQSTAVGYRALYTATGGYNTALGYGAGYSHTTGAECTYLGGYAGYSATTGNSNTFVGHKSGRYQAGAYNNTAVGMGSMEGAGTSSSNTYYNTAIGFQALWKAYQTVQFNTAVGAFSLYNADNSSIANTGVGFRSGIDISTGDSNTLIGYTAGCDLTTEYGNTCIGSGVMASNAAGASYATAVGYDALYRNQKSYNVAVGGYALFNNITGEENVSVGYASGYTNDSGNDGTFVGYAAGRYSLGNNNTVVGWKAFQGSSNTTSAATDNTCIGSAAGYSLTTGAANTYIGTQSGFSLTSGSNNTAVGYQSMYGASTYTAASNSALGYKSLYAITTGAGNVAMGYQAGATGYNNITTGTNNTLIGYLARASASGAVNQIVIGANAYGVGNNSITLGDTSITNIYCKATSITGISDESAKEDIKAWDGFGLDFIAGLTPKTFKYKDDPNHNVRLGLVAQDVKAAMKGKESYGIVSTIQGGDMDGIMCITYGDLIFPLINAVKELKLENDDLRSRIEKLEGKKP